MQEITMFGRGFVALLEESPPVSVRMDVPKFPSYMFGNLIGVAEVPTDAGGVPHVIRLEFEFQAVQCANGDGGSVWCKPWDFEHVREIAIQIGCDVMRESTQLGTVWRVRDRDRLFTFHPGRLAIDFASLAPPQPDSER